MELNAEEEAFLKKHLQNYTQKSDVEREAPLESGLPELDQFFRERGGLRFGRVVEWGVPPGRCGRFIVLRFLRKILDPVIWACGQEEDYQVYAPAWASQGIDLSKFYFVRSPRPLPDLRPLFLSPGFRVIVLDSPEKLSAGDWSFISARVRENNQLLFVLRPFFLSRNRGNPLAHWRLNCWLRERAGKFRLNVLKGGEGNFEFPLKLVRHP